MFVDNMLSSNWRNSTPNIVKKIHNFWYISFELNLLHCKLHNYITQIKQFWINIVDRSLSFSGFFLLKMSVNNLSCDIPAKLCLHLTTVFSTLNCKIFFAQHFHFETNLTINHIFYFFFSHRLSNLNRGTFFIIFLVFGFYSSHCLLLNKILIIWLCNWLPRFVNHFQLTRSSVYFGASVLILAKSMPFFFSCYKLRNFKSILTTVYIRLPGCYFFILYLPFLIYLFHFRIILYL